MKNLSYSALLACFLIAPFAALATDDAKILINCSNLDDSGGNLVYTLYATEESYNAEKNELAHLTVSVAAGDVDTAAFNHLKPGIYTVTAFHDSNMDGELNTGAFGRPKEQFAISNISRRLWSKPHWQETSFEVRAGDPKSINLLFKMQ